MMCEGITSRQSEQRVRRRALTNLLLYWVLDFRDHPVKLIAHSLGSDTSGGALEVLEVTRIGGVSCQDRTLEVEGSSRTMAEAPRALEDLTPGADGTDSDMAEERRYEV